MDHEPGLARLRARRPARESLDSIWLPPEASRRRRGGSSERASPGGLSGWISGARCRPVEERARGGAPAVRVLGLFWEDDAKRRMLRVAMGWPGTFESPIGTNRALWRRSMWGQLCY